MGKTYVKWLVKILCDKLYGNDRLSCLLRKQVGKMIIHAVYLKMCPCFGDGILLETLSVRDPSPSRCHPSSLCINECIVCLSKNKFLCAFYKIAKLIGNGLIDIRKYSCRDQRIKLLTMGSRTTQPHRNLRL